MVEGKRVLRIIVASPCDVQAERDVVPGVVDEVNRWIASLLGVSIEVARWETDAYPGFHLEGPQKLIDHVLRIEDSDILIGIFWTRFGTPTRDGTTGTEHEIRRGVAAWKERGRPQIMVYFNHKPYSPRSSQETDQWGKVLEFKRGFPAEGLWWPYSGKHNFERLLRNHLMNFVRDNFMGPMTQAVSPYSEALQQIELLPPAPNVFVGRDGDLQELKLRLSVASGGQTSAPTRGLAVVRGWPGVGKSSVAAALAYDREVRTHFRDGVLWVSLGEKPSLISALATWGRALGEDQLFTASTVQEAVIQLTALLTKKRILLIVDDVWETEHAIPFQRIKGESCALLFTTRETKVAEAIAPVRSSIHYLPVLTDESALELLGLLAPTAVTDYPSESRDLVRDLECLPLALHVGGHMLNAEANFGWNVRDMLLELRSGAKIIKEKAPADRADVEAQTIPTVAALFKQSTDRLSRLARDCFAYLAPFAPKPATFDVDALRAVWQVEDPKPLIRELVGHGLMEPVGGRFQVHALLIAHARSMLTE